MYKYPIVYRGINAAKVFMEVAIKKAEEIEYLYSNKKSMIPLTKEQQDVYDSSSHCYICSGIFTKEDWKVRDHCHLTDVDNIDENGGKGYILEVDLEYPESLHDDHSDLPLAPESSVSPGCLVLKKVHKILEFHQESWLQPYINMNTQFRTEAENEFEKIFYKLMNNAIFGKTMENIRKRVDIRLCNNGEKAEKLISKPNFKDRTIFCENSAAFHMEVCKLSLSLSLYPSKNPDIMETVDTKQENYQNQSADRIEDKINTLTSLSPKEHVITRPKEETSVDTIEEEIGSIAPVKCKNIPKKILNFIQQNQGEI
ncbi:c2H2-type domain-containing protein [Trichonephila clavipes]|nr:c2H2-type domain-containing protein [Trichonephila clavipes]